MIIEVPTARLTISKQVIEPVQEIVVYTFNEHEPFVHNIVYVDFARGPPLAA